MFKAGRTLCGTQRETETSDTWMKCICNLRARAQMVILFYLAV